MLQNYDTQASTHSLDGFGVRVDKGRPEYQGNAVGTHLVVLLVGDHISQVAQDGLQHGHVVGRKLVQHRQQVGVDSVVVRIP